MAGLAPPEFLGQEWGGQRGIDNFMKGFALMSQVAARRRESELQIAEMHQQAYLAQQKHDLDMKKFEQDAPLIKAQIDEQESLAGLHNQQVLESKEGVRTAAQRKQELLKRVGSYANRLAKIDAPPGTQAWQNQFDLIDNDPEFFDIKGTAEYARVRNAKLAEHQKSVIQNRISQNSMDDKVNRFLKNTGLGLGAFNNEKDWGRNKDDNSYFINQDLKTGAVLPLSTDVKAHPDLYRSITLPESEYKFYKGAADHIKDRIKNSLHAPDPSDTRTPTDNPADIKDDEQIVIDPAPGDPSQRVPGKVYQLPKGKFKWTGNGWTTP